MSARVVLGDCRALMAAMDADSVDAVVCDPPYGLSFMGKGWDRGVPGDEFWLAALRVAKPGAHLVAFGGTRTHHRLMCAIEDAGWEIRDCLMWLYGSGFPKSHNGAWGGTALKPAWEPIILARKPLSGTVAANVLAHGTGALNIDATRIGDGGGTAKGDPPKEKSGGICGDGINGACNILDIGKGRWPANVVLDEEAATLLDEQSGERAAGVASGRSRGFGNEYVGATTPSGYNGEPQGYGDTGGASRFFYTAKASRSEREHGLDELPEVMTRRYGEQGQGPTPQQTPRTAVASRNVHPTVKPVELMRWLVRLVTPPRGLVLDPFAGSGSTGVACIAEGFAFEGHELEPEHVAISNARLDAAQPSLFA